MKTCSKCAESKAEHEFHIYRRKGRRDGLRAQCKACHYQATIRYFETPKGREIRAANDRKQRMANYGITPAEYDSKLEEQGGVCKVCKRPCPSGRALAVDHDHRCCPGQKSCGKCLRDLLCGPCNDAFGLLSEDYDRIIALAAYASHWAAEEAASDD